MTSISSEFKEIVEALQEDNQELREIIAEQDAKLERAIYAICQLHSGLYNEHTQEYVIIDNAALLFGNKRPQEPEEPVNLWPTTRQGDKHELRISKLEETIQQLQQQILRLENKLKVK